MDAMIEFLLGTQNFMPHGACFLWTPELLWLLVVTDIVIALSYFSIPLALIYFVYQRKDIENNRILVLFSVFIFACGVTHVMSVVSIWIPVYGLMGVIKFITAIVSFVTAVYLCRSIPQMLALPSVKHLMKLNNSLTIESASHKKTKNELKQLNDGLDSIVELRVKELEKFNQELKDNKEKFELLLNTVDDGIYGLDLTGNTTFINPAACKILGCEEADIIGQPVNNLLNDGSNKQCDNKISPLGFNSSAINNNEIIKSEHFLCLPHKCLPIDFSRTPLKKKDKISGYVVVFRDISEQKETEDLLIQAKNVAEKAREIAEEANKAKSQFLSRMSHELRTPMNAILGFAQLLEADDLSEGQQDDVSEILSAGNHLMDLINEVLELATIESGKLEVKLENIQLNKVILASLSLVKVMASKHSITIINQISTESNFTLKADEVRLKQVLVNLLSNAIKYNSKEGTITLSYEKLADKLRINVFDTGKGMTEEELAYLFQPFERLGAADSAIQGTGIGLVITKNIVELMHGNIHVESTLGTGTLFSIELPLATGLK